MTTERLLRCPGCKSGDDLRVQCQAVYQLDANGNVGRLVSQVSDHNHAMPSDPVMCGVEGCEWQGSVVNLITTTRDAYQNETVTRDAPRWAWDVIDETLSMDAQSGAFEAKLRVEIGDALEAMISACEQGDG